ncbi:MAG: DUF1501 domain-containing protein [Roseibacillus sp.]
MQLLRTRREFLARAGGGFGALALSQLLRGETASATHFPARAKSVIYLFMEGGPSHIDLFDPKPQLNYLAGQQLPESFGTVITAMGEQRSPLLASPRQWMQHGQSGLWISDWLPHIAKHADDLCILRSCQADGLNHVSSVCQMNTGSLFAGRPSLGSWVTYGLGTENENLPAFMVLLDEKKRPHGGNRNWGTGFMPATYQGVEVAPGKESIPNLRPADSAASQRQKLDLLKRLNKEHAAERPYQSELEARINAYEMAFRMQSETPAVFDLGQESEATKEMYGLEDKATHAMAHNCILARRLVERGVRFVQLYSGSGSKWDSHAQIEENHSRMCRSMDQPVGALLADLKARGLLDETLVIWGGEFGRTPMSEKGNGRDHNPFGFTIWFAGAGVRGGQTIGTTDELGLRAEEEPAHVRDIHATILHALGLDHMKLTFANNGRRENLTINEGAPILKVFA